jgi:hypothetical protein
MIVDYFEILRMNDRHVLSAVARLKAFDSSLGNPGGRDR